MGRRKKELHYGSRSGNGTVIRQSDENRLEDLGSVESHERFTCKPCGKLTGSCACKGTENG